MSPSISIIIGFKCFHNQIFIFTFLQSDERCKCKIKVKMLKNLYLFYPSKPKKKAGNPQFSRVSDLKLTAGIEPATYALRVRRSTDWAMLAYLFHYIIYSENGNSYFLIVSIMSPQLFRTGCNFCILFYICSKIYALTASNLHSFHAPLASSWAIG